MDHTCLLLPCVYACVRVCVCACVEKQLNTQTQRFTVVRPLVTTNGPKASMPTCANGKLGVTLSGGSGAICCFIGRAHRRLHIRHLWRACVRVCVYACMRVRVYACTRVRVYACTRVRV